jgi:hypothetical protein
MQPTHFRKPAIAVLGIIVRVKTGSPADHADWYILGAEVWSPQTFGAGGMRAGQLVDGHCQWPVWRQRGPPRPRWCVRPRPAEPAC